MTPTHLVAVTEWVNWVAQATGVPSGADPEAAIKTRAVVLAEKYLDTRMFTQTSAAFVAVECGLMALPAVGILCKFLEKWWDKNKPAQPALASPWAADLAQASLSPEDRMAVTVWLQRDAEAFLSQRDMVGRLAVIRQANAAGFQWLVAHNMRAQDIARDRGWLREDTSEDYTDPQRILASVRGILHPPHPQAEFWLRSLRAAVERHAPHLADLVPLDVKDTAIGGAQRTPTPQQYVDMRSDEGIVVPSKAESQPPAARKPHGALTPEQLHEVRMNNPALRPFAEQKAARQAEIDAGAIYEDYLPEAVPEPEPEPLRAAAKVIPMRKKRAPMPYDDDEVPA